MSNPSKAKGTALESAVVTWLNRNGFPFAERIALSGKHDRGDVGVYPGPTIIFECKSVAKGATGQPPEGMLAKWMAETATERDNAGADVGVLVVKRKGTTDVGRYFAYVDVYAFAVLLGAPDPLALPDPDAPLCTSLASLTPVLRAAGYGVVPE